MSSITFPAAVFSAETLAQNSTLIVSTDSPILSALKAIRNFASQQNGLLEASGTLQTIAVRRYEILRNAELPLLNDASFVVTFNGAPLIIGHPNGTVSINLQNDIKHDDVPRRIIQNDELPPIQPLSPIPPQAAVSQGGMFNFGGFLGGGMFNFGAGKGMFDSCGIQ
jgi:hypothetical protein